ncbi:hypothetical protein HCN44_008973 [Aphidius gifuensis]|uniref:Uncharacterized protein n=1 Tax=Aphidius gifuensis TaxID=684658 RepID=A0A834XS89_APHGI|nr:hypothetical protein HCN44_008973 [Aphidius gifuensis]
MKLRSSVIVQGSAPASIDDVVNDNKTECLGSRRSLRLSSKTRRDGIAKCMKQNTQIKKNIEKARLSDSSQLRSRSVTAQGSTPEPVDDVVNDDETKCLGNRRSLRLSSKTRRDGIAKCVKQNTQIKKNIKNATLLKSSTSLEVLKMTRLAKTVQQMTDNLAERVKSLESMINVVEHMSTSGKPHCACR